MFVDAEERKKELMANNEMNGAILKSRMTLALRQLANYYVK